jgi:DNA-binding transcriptional MerR regulator
MMANPFEPGERTYRSIGEVLALVQDEFPEITISKIRFLESQGLIDPERTASGYRKFYARDVERLRFILRSQKDAYLPLKVIKDRLAAGDDVDRLATADASQAANLAMSEGSWTGSGDAVAAVATVVEARALDALVEAPAERLPVWMLPKPPVVPTPVRAISLDSGLSMSFDELVKASGLPHAQVREIESFGLIGSTAVGRERLYDEDALLITKLVAGFVAHGLEPRHLRMYRTAVDREAGLFEQVAAPLIKQRNPQAKVEAQRRLEAMADLGEQLRGALLRSALRPYNSSGGGVS